MSDLPPPTPEEIDRAATLCAMTGGRPTKDEWEFMRGFTRRAIKEVERLKDRLEDADDEIADLMNCRDA